MERITAVVVTYNRFQLVQKTIESLRNQTRKLDSIIVIDNHATDGTGEWLDTQLDLTVIHQENVGGSGGFYRGIKEAYERGFDWIWCMDDDVYPRKDCLENLLAAKSDNVGILCPRRIIDGQDFCGEYTKLNLSSLFIPFHQEMTPMDFYKQSEPFPIMGMSFEGPLISKNVVSKIGLPNKDLFILFDDTEYSYRATCSGFDVLVTPRAILDKENFRVSKSQAEIVKSSSWKLYFEIRNNSYMHKVYGRTFMIKTLKPLLLLLQYDLAFLKNIFTDKYCYSDFLSWHKAYIDGQRKKLVKR